MSVIKTKKYTNFYETIKEASMRLQHSVVLYDGIPYYVWAIAPHDDGIYRVYMEEIGKPGVDMLSATYGHFGYDTSDPEARRAVLDQFMKDYPKAGLIRKKINSPKFNQFRPFPLGMCNKNGYSLYLERCPTRCTLQGLSYNGVICKPIAVMTVPELLADRNMWRRNSFQASDMMSPEFKDCILGEYPDLDESFTNLMDDNIKNKSVGISRVLALVRAPMGMIYLAYKGDIVGFFPENNNKRLLLDAHARNTLEAIQDHNFFDNIEIR